MFNFIVEWLKKMFLGVSKKPEYKITEVSSGVYDIAVVLPAVGTLHYSMKFDAVNDTFTLSGKIAIVGDDAGFPIAAFQGMINDAFSSWVSDNVVKVKLADHVCNMKIKHQISLGNVRKDGFDV